MSSQQEIATLAGGCFWCLEAVYDRVDGVVSVESGYTGGETAHPTYEQVCSGETGHAEAVRGRIDLAAFSYQSLSTARFGNGEEERLHAQWVSGAAFDLLGVRAALGRLFTAKDDLHPGQHQVAVLS
jgi:peptide-methionine (S)-S-oxide reductase